VVMKLDNLLRLVSPLPEHESFYFHFLRIYHHTCRLLFIHHCLHETRRVVACSGVRPWYLLAEHNGINLAIKWGQEAMLLAEDIISSTVSRPELEELTTAPDIVFAMLCFAASFIIMCKISIHQIRGEQLPGASDDLLARITERLMQAACSPDHAPVKCAQLINGLISNYEARIMEGDENLGPKILPHNISSERTVVANREPELPRYPVDRQSQLDVSMPAHGLNVDLNRLMNSEVMLDSEFWASFMDNLTTDVSYVEGVRSN